MVILRVKLMVIQKKIRNSKKNWYRALKNIVLDFSRLSSGLFPKKQVIWHIDYTNNSTFKVWLFIHPYVMNLPIVHCNAPLLNSKEHSLSTPYNHNHTSKKFCLFKSFLLLEKLVISALFTLGFLLQFHEFFSDI